MKFLILFMTCFGEILDKNTINYSNRHVNVNHIVRGLKCFKKNTKGSDIMIDGQPLFLFSVSYSISWIPPQPKLLDYTEQSRSI